MLGLATQASVYHWSIEGYLPFQLLYMLVENWDPDVCEPGRKLSQCFGTCQV
jgi:hypothetical protein